MHHQRFTRRNSWVSRSLALLLTLSLGWVLTQPALAALVWQLQTVDSAGSVGAYTALALDSSGNPAISYLDFGNGDLKLVHCGNATCTSGNTLQTVDSAGFVGEHNSLALDSSGNPVISYYDNTNGDLKLVHCGDAACSSGNTIQTVDSAGFVGLFTALVLDSSGNPVISYYDLTNDDLKLVHCGNAACASGNTIQIVDSAGVVGRYTALALDSSGNPVISYYDASNGVLKLVHCGNITCSSGNTIQTVDSTGDVGRYTSLRLDSSGNPVISYYDFSNGVLKLVHCGDAACASGNTLQTVDSAGFVGQYTSLALDNSGNPVISYYDVTNGDLKLAQCGNTTCTSGNSIQTMDSTGAVGGYTALALDSSGNPVISYFDASNLALKLARLVDDPPPSVTLNQAAGQADPTNSNPVIFTADFSEAVTGFTAEDVTLSGTANLAGATVTVSGGPSSYTVSVDGVAGNGTVMATLAANGATDAAGSGNTASTSTDNSVTFDSSGPLITPSVVGTLGANGWYVSDVSVSWSVVDAESTINSQTGCDPLTLTSDTASVTYTCSASSAGGSSSQSVTIKRDATAPLVTVTGVSDGAAYTLGSAPAAGCDTSDALSDVATPATVSITGGNGDGTGVFTATCSGATDQAGNTTNPVSVTYTVNAIVQTLYQQVQAVRASLAALLPSGDSKTDKSLHKAIAKIDQALAANLWQADGNHLTLIGDDVFNRLRDAVQELAKIKNPPSAVGAASTSLTGISRTLAQIALDEAISGNGDAKKIAKAQSKLSKGDAEAAKGKLAKAIAQYEDAWEYAQQALGLPVASSLAAEEQAEVSDEDGTEESSEPAAEENETGSVTIFLPLINR